MRWGTLKRTIVIGPLIGMMLASLSGCTGIWTDDGQAGNDAPAASGSPTPGPKPELVLATAVIGLGKQNLKFTVDGGTGDVRGGSLDAASGAVKVTADVDGSPAELITYRDDIYIGGLRGDGKWLHARVPKFKDGAIPFVATADPLFGARFLGSASDVQQGQPNTLSGTADLTRVIASGTTQLIAHGFGKAAGTKATALPFTATVDDAGALSAVNMVFPKADRGKDLVYNLKITEVGGAVTITVPAENETVPAPADFYTVP